MSLGGADKAGLDALKVFGEAGYERLVISTNVNDRGNRWTWLFEQNAEKVVDINPADHGRVRRGVDPFLEELRSFQPDVVLINNSLMGYEKLPLLRQSLPGARIGCLYHMILKVWPFENQLLQFSDSWDVCMATSERLRGQLLKHGLPDHKVEVVYSGGYHPDQRFSNEEAASWRENLRKRLNISSHRRAILFAFRFHFQKRPEMIARIAAHLDPGKFVIVCAGDGPKQGPVQRFCLSEAGKHDFRWLGPVDLPEMQKLYAACDYMVLPSLDEGLPLSFFESMESGIPIIASDVGGNSELVTPETGRLIKLGRGDSAEAKLYADAIRDLDANPALRARLVADARQRVDEQFSWRLHAENTFMVLTNKGHHQRFNPKEIFAAE